MTRSDLHRLVDDLPDASVEPAGILLERAKDPEPARLSALEWDDEPYTDQERAEDEAALKEPAIPWDEAKRELLAD